MLIREMINHDIQQVSKVHSMTFPRQRLSEQWVTCNFNAFPKIRYFVAEIENEVLGYIQWTERSGFRKEVVLELEQIAVVPASQNQGIGTELISKSLVLVKRELEKRQALLKHILISTRTDNHAQEIYQKILNAKPEILIKDLFSGDEVIMISRNFIFDERFDQETN